MKAKHYLYLTIAGLAVFSAGYLVGKAPATQSSCAETETIEMAVDTTMYRAPIQRSETVLGTLPYKLPVSRIADAGFEQSTSDESVVGDTVIPSAMYGAGAEGKPRCSADSAVAELPLIQRHYADSAYEAWVSGPVAPRLDSLRGFTPTTVITRREWKPPKRWHIGLTAGYGYGPKGLHPYVGIGITYSIISF